MKTNNDNTKLTSVKILNDVYSKFKYVSFYSDITLQKIVNRSLHRYGVDENFRREIHECIELQVSGSRY